MKGVTAEVLAERAARRDVLLPHPKPGAATLGMQVNPSILRMEPARLAQIFKECLAG